LSVFFGDYAQSFPRAISSQPASQPELLIYP